MRIMLSQQTCTQKTIHRKPYAFPIHSGKMLYWMLASLHLMIFCLPQLNVSVSFVGTLVTTGPQVLESPCNIKKQTNQINKQKQKTNESFLKWITQPFFQTITLDSAIQTTEEATSSYCHQRTYCCPGLHAHCYSSSWQNFKLLWSISE